METPKQFIDPNEHQPGEGEMFIHSRRHTPKQPLFVGNFRTPSGELVNIAVFRTKENRYIIKNRNRK